MTLKQYEECYVVDALQSSTTASKQPTIPVEEEDSEERGEADEEDEPLLPLDSLECVLDVKTEPGTEEAESEEVVRPPKPIKLEARERPGPLSALQRAALAAASTGSPSAESGSKTAKMVWVPWFESKLTSCLICGETRTCGLSFKNHLYDRHKYMSRKEYMRRFPEADIEPAQWSCLICRNTVKWTKKCIVDHLRVAHNLTRESFESAYNLPPNHQVPSPGSGAAGPVLNARTEIGIANRASVSSGGGDSAESASAVHKAKLEGGQYACSLCEEQVAAAAFPEHISDYHKMTRESYLKLCPDDAPKFVVVAPPVISKWVCKICEEEVDEVGDKVQEHLVTQHDLEVDDYRQAYEAEDDLEDTGNLIMDEVEEPENNEEDQIVVPEMGEEGALRGHSIFEADDDIGESSSPGTAKSSSLPVIPPWYESVKIRCQECNNELWLGAFMKHIILTHKLPIKVYKTKYPETVIPRRQYQCRICGITVSHYASPISGHLSGRHNITMTDYYLRYEKPQVAPPSPPPPPVLPSLLSVEFERKRSHHRAGLSEDFTEADSPPASKNLRMAEYQKTGKIPWYESRITDCRLCGEEWLLGSFRRHLYDRQGWTIK
jgi:predicted transcriptional regulator